MRIAIELLVFFACILIGARLGGIALGTIAGVGLAIFVFIFALPPGGPPPGVLGMIIAVITALATMQAAGGLDYLVSLAERVLRRHPQHIVFIAPVVTYLLVLGSGTTHVIYALLPVIAEVSRKGDVRPERPLSISVIAGFHGNIASPISAATVAMLGLMMAQGSGGAGENRVWRPALCLRRRMRLRRRVGRVEEGAGLHQHQGAAAARGGRAARLLKAFARDAGRNLGAAAVRAERRNSLSPTGDGLKVSRDRREKL